MRRDLILRELVRGVRHTQGRKISRLHDHYPGFAGMLEDLASCVTCDVDTALLVDLPKDQGIRRGQVDGYAVAALPSVGSAVRSDTFARWLIAEFTSVFARPPNTDSVRRAVAILAETAQGAA